MSFQLRDYQLDCLEKIKQSILNGNKSIVVQSPPRTGKTVIMSEIARRATAKGNRVMFIIHRQEVLDQAKATFEANNVDMELASFGMVQTYTRRLNTLEEPSIIFVDEAHHALANSYQRILNAFPHALKLLFTATPTRLGHDQLDKVATDLVLGKSVKELIGQGFLAPFDYYSINDIDLKKLKKKSTGGYTNASMDEAISATVFGSVTEHYQRLAQGKQAVVYCHSVKSAKNIADEFRKLGISAAEIDGATDKKERERLISQFRNQEITILTNVELFTEGLDLPNVDCVIMVRPTDSLSLYLQFAMRCLNPRDGKKAIIIDHVANYMQHGLPSDDRDWKALMVSTTKRKRADDDRLNIIQCEHCLKVFEREEVTGNECPNCGMPLRKKLSEPVTTQAELKKITEKPNISIKTIAQRLLENSLMQNVAGKSLYGLSTYKEFEAYAQLYGKSKRWAYMMFNNLRKG